MNDERDELRQSKNEIFTLKKQLASCMHRIRACVLYSAGFVCGFLARIRGHSSVLRRVFETLKPIPSNNLESLVLTTPGACREDGGNRGKTTTLNGSVGGSFAATWARVVLKKCSSERWGREKRF